MAKTRTDTESVLKLVINGQQAKTSAKEIEDSYRKVRAELKNLREEDNPQLYAEKRRQVEALKRAWDESREAISGNTKAVKGFKASMLDIAKGVFAGNIYTRGFDLLTKGLSGFISKNSELSDVMAGVQKTTGLTGEAVDRLNQKFKKFDTRTANTELLNLAQVAGKLGITAEKDVEGFVRAADRIGVALGEDLGGVEESVNSLGKLTDIFKLKDRFGIEDALMRVGSAINTLGASGTAAEKNLVDFAQRMAGIAPAAGISLPSVLGMAATMDELGQSMESSSTAIGQFIVGLGKDIPKNAKIAGMSAKDFAKLLREDAMEALIRVLEGSKTAGGGLETLAKNMGVLEISGARGIAALGALADRTDLLRERQKQANEAFVENTSIMAEFDNMNTTLAANLEKLQNRLEQQWEKSALRYFFTDLTGWLVDSRSHMQKLADSSAANNAEFAEMERKINPLLERYEELNGKVNKSHAEHLELREVIDQLIDHYPGAASEVNEYGQAISVSTELVKQLIEAEKLLMLQQNATAIERIRVVETVQKREIDNIKRTRELRRNARNIDGSPLTPEQQQAISRSIGVLNDRLKEAENRLRTTQLQLRQLGEDVSFTPTEEELQDMRKWELKFGALKERYEEINALKKAGKALTKEELAVLEEYERATGSFRPVETAGGGGETPEAKKAREKAERAAQRKRDQAKREYDKLLKDFNALDAARLLQVMSKNSQEVAASEAKYNALIEEYRAFVSMEGTTDEQRAEADKKVKELEVQRDQASKDILLKQQRDYLEKIEGLRDSLRVKHESELDKERVRINQFYDRLLKENEGNEEAMAAIRAARAQELADAEIREAERLKREKERLETEYLRGGMSKYEVRLADINAKYDAEIAALKQKFDRELQLTEEFQAAVKAIEEGRRAEIKKLDEQELEDKINLAVRGAEIVADAVFQISANNRQADSDARLEQLRKDREAELRNRNLTEAQKKAINDKYDRLEKAEKRRAWQAQKKADMTQAVIATALGVAKAIPNWVQMGLAAAAGAAQVAVIASQKPPVFARGGLLPEGSSHAQGGIDLWDRRRQRVIGNIEGGEPILSRETYRNNRAIVDELLYSSMRRNGARVRLNPELIDADRAVRNGGAVLRGAGGKAPVVKVSTPPVDLSGLEGVVRDLAEVVRDSNGKPVVISYRMLQDADERVNRITNNVNS